MVDECIPHLSSISSFKGCEQPFFYLRRPATCHFNLWSWVTSCSFLTVSGVFRVFQRAGGREHPRQLCDHLRTLRRADGFRIPADHGQQDFTGVSVWFESPREAAGDSKLAAEILAGEERVATDGWRAFSAVAPRLQMSELRSCCCVD